MLTEYLKIDHGLFFSTSFPSLLLNAIKHIETNAIKHIETKTHTHTNKDMTS